MGFDPGAFSNSLLRGLSVGQGLVMNADNIRRQKQLDQERSEDRQYNRDRQAVIDQRAEQQFGWQQQQHDMLMKRYAEEEETKQMYKDLVFMEQAIESGSYDTPEFFAATNRVFADMVNVGGPEGSTKEVVGASVTPDGSGFIPRLKVTTADGKSYPSPATLPNRDHTDKDVMVIPFRQFFDEMGSRKQYLQNLLKNKAAQLDPKGYLENKRAVAAEERKNQLALDKEERDHAFELKKLDKEYGLKRGLEAAKEKSGASGKSDLIQLRTGRTTTLDDLRKSYIATYGKADPMGNLIGTVDGAPTYEAWVNGQAVQPVFTAQEKPAVDMNDPVYLEAQKRAEKWAVDQAGYLSSDKSDFSAYGGNRQQAIAEKTLEFYDMLKNGKAPQPQGSGGHPAAGGVQASGKGKEPKQQKPTKLDPGNQEHVQIAREILKEAKGDKAKARQIAKQRGYSF
jgi:hypothetical protein